MPAAGMARVGKELNPRKLPSYLPHLEDLRSVWKRLTRLKDHYSMRRKVAYMALPSIYLDTTIISAYWYEGADRIAWLRHLVTREWWETERQHFRLFASLATRDELAGGRFRRQDDCLKMVNRLPFLAVTRKVVEFSDELVAAGIVPSTKPGDAMQMAVACLHNTDYLLTWNYAHLANPIAQKRLSELCSQLQYSYPIMVTPDSIPRASLGQDTRRSK